MIEISCGFITIPADDWLRLIERVMTAGVKAKPEIGIRFGAGGADDPDVFAWYIRSYGPEVNLFVDHSQIVQLESCARVSGERRIPGDVF